MSDVQFTLPSISSAEMSVDDQAKLLVNQATANIVGAWLAHCNAVLQYGTAKAPTPTAYTVTATELADIINSVQIKLSTIGKPSY